MEKYTVTSHFRCTAQESEEIRKRAENEKKSTSAYLRDAALNRNVPEVDEKTREILKGLADNELKIGVNINQAVRICNTNKNVSREDYEKLTQMLVRILEYRKRISAMISDMS